MDGMHFYVFLCMCSCVDYRIKCFFCFLRFRGRIIAIEEKRIKVFFIDYGNTERVKKKLVRKLPIRLKTMRPCAIRIASGDFQQSVEDLSAEFNQYIIDGVFRITIFEKVKVDATAAIDIDSGEPVISKAKIEFKVDEKWIGMAVILEHGGKGNKGMYNSKCHGNLSFLSCVTNDVNF